MRFGIANSALFATVTTDASCGAVNAMHDSFTPLGGLVPLFNMQLGEVIFGGVGAGLYGMLIFAVLAVFIAGLMVGRTPEYLGKKIEACEVKMAMLADPGAAALSILGFASASPSVWPAGLDRARTTPAPTASREMLYAFTSGTGQQRQRLRRPHRQHALLQHHPRARHADRPLRDDRPDAGPGRLARGQEDGAAVAPAPSRPTATLFVGLLIGVVLIVGGLTYFPALSLGPIVEHFVMHAPDVSS